MSKILLALRKAHHEGKRAPTLNGMVNDLLLSEPAVAESSRKAVRRNKVRTKRNASDSSQARDLPGRIDEHLVAFHDTNTSVAEQYRKLYVEFVQAGQVRELRTLLISSAMAGEGKTTTALNLAITMAASGGERGVLVVETDLRKPTVQKFLGTRPACGLADYLLGDVEYAQMFTQTEIPGLTVVHAGRRVANPPGLLSSEKMGQFFKEVKSQDHYSHIILDACPLLLTSEPKSLIQHVDSTILVVHARQTPREMVAQAIETLGVENILGCVFNGITSTDSYYYRSYYSSDYYHANHHS